MLRNVDAKHTSVSALPVIPLRISTANDIVSVHQPATGKKKCLKKNDEGFFLEGFFSFGGFFLLLHVSCSRATAWLAIPDSENARPKAD